MGFCFKLSEPRFISTVEASPCQNVHLRDVSSMTVIRGECTQIRTERVSNMRSYAAKIILDCCVFVTIIILNLFI
jgi:hypothetical protein